MNQAESKQTTGVSVQAVSLEPSCRSLLAAYAEVRVGDIILTVAVCLFRDGSRHVYLPTWEDRGSVLDAVELPLDLRAEVERETLAAYEQAEARQKARQRHPEEQ